MAQNRPAKRQRVGVGGAHRDPVPFADDFTAVHAREARVVRVGKESLSVPTERLTLREADEAWNSAPSWLPIDDPQYALDPDGEWYDEVVEGDVTESFDVHPTDSQPTAAKGKKRVRSGVSRRPHVFWKDVHRQTYLEEVVRWAGRGDFFGAKECSDCVSRQRAISGSPQYRCRECFLPDLTCQLCCVKRHRSNPLHRVERWTGSQFIEVSLKSLGLKIQLNHASMFCENPITCHAALLIIHTNGIHEVAVQYCGCSRAIAPHIQLLRRGFYPASQQIVKTCATFTLLDLLHKLALASKASTYDFYRALEKLSNNTGISIPKNRYRGLFRIAMQWRHLKLLKWGGRAHDPAGVTATRPGELALLCPSCPHPGINLPENWENAPAGMKFLYMLFLCMDANFRLKNQMVSNYSQDPGLGIGWAYMLPREEYEAYVLSRASDGDISTCVGLQALAKMNSKFSRGLRYTGVGGVMCGRSEMIMPLGIGNLQKGERYANMDFIIASVIQAFVIQTLALIIILLSYDIACQWFVNLFVRMEEHWPPRLRIPATTKLIPAIPKLHEPMHGRKNHEGYSLNFIPGVGKADMETPERVWAGHNGLGNSTKTQGPGGRHDVLDDHFSFWNWLKYTGLGKTLISRYKAALAERNRQAEGHRGLTNSLNPELVAKWEAMCLAWEEDEYPKSSPNPYEVKGASMTEAEVRKEFAEDEELRIAAGEESLHATSPSTFVFLGLELEELQRRVRRQAKTAPQGATARQSSSLTEQRNILRTRLLGWEEILPIYMPGLPQHRASFDSDPSGSSRSQPVAGAGLPENAAIWLPSKIPTNFRSRVCYDGLAAIEEKIRTANCYDSLDAVRHVLNIKSRLVHFKNKSARGQREGNRSRTIIDRVHERARVAAERYRAARCGKLALAGAGEWEKVLRILEDGDIRAYQDVEKLRTRVGRPGTLEDGQLVAVEADAAEEGMDARAEDSNTAGVDSDGVDLMGERREKRDGTGETRRALSWIWTSGSRSADPDDEGDNILQSEWAKSRARVGRCREEVLLLKEEMRRVVAFLEWKTTWWMDRRNKRGGVSSGVNKELQEGLAAYAEGQADLQKSLREHFCALWRLPLVGNGDALDDGHNDGSDEDDDDDEADDGEGGGPSEAAGEDVYEDEDTYEEDDEV